MNHTSILVAIVGGSGSGKTWLCRQLGELWGNQASALSLDDFYRDRSHLSPRRRERINYDHPRAIDWTLLEEVLESARQGLPCQLPQYDFAAHSRKTKTVAWAPKGVVLLDGLWLLWKPKIRRLFSWSIYIDCPADLRLFRRMERDVAERGRSKESVRDQFVKTVVPMHDQYVQPQNAWADVILQAPIGRKEVTAMAERVGCLRQSLLASTAQPLPKTKRRLYE